MRIAAIWIEEHVIIKNQYFNFGGKVNFDFKFDEDQRKLFVEANENLGFVDIFEDYKNISSVTGLIGMNGSGKTTLLKMLNTIEVELPFSLPIVFIIEHEVKLDNLEYSIVVYYSKKKITDRKDLIIDLPKEGILSNSRLEKNEIIITQDFNPFTNNQILFYSSLYSSQNDKFLSEHNPRNRSVQYRTLLALSPENLSRQIAKFEEDKKNNVIFHEASFNVLRPYFHNRLKDQIHFLSKLNKEHYELIKTLNGITFPKTLRFWLNKYIFSKSVELMKQSHYSGFGVIKELNEVCFKLINEEPEIKKKLRGEIIITLFNYCFANDFFQQGGASLNVLERFLLDLEHDKLVFERIINFMKTQTSSNMEFDFGRAISVFVELDEILSQIQVSKNDGVFSFGTYDIEVNEASWDFTDRFLGFGFSSDDSFLEYGWVGMSAGEEALLNQFTELFLGIQEIDSDSCLISIDEGELFLHAEWQRKYLFSLIEFIDHFMKYFHNEVKAQILLTTHSSFIPSDLTRDNLIFFEKDKDTGLVRINKSFNHEATLGGNIFNLLSNSFYLDDFIGEFSKRTIQNFLKDLFILRDRKEKISIDEFLIMQRKVNVIGDDIIRNRMQEILSLIPSEFLDVENEILDLKAKLKVLEQRKKI